ncbi:keratin, type I cytoskeletal 19-like [Mobula birostris]|uniref:keratin, type I cytoskeletal 19-like n=1 Tax=Mobula birostris TaxID=1983395 RepID=UPI003B28CDFE
MQTSFRSSSSGGQSWGSRSMSGVSSSMRGGSMYGFGQSRASSYGLGSALGAGMVYGSGGGFGSGLSIGFGGRFSSASGGGYSISSAALLNEKQTMQGLNDRLATYLDQVRSLEKSNAELELQIREYYQQAGPTTRDYSECWATIKGLRDQINDLILANSGIMLQVDNSKLAAEDFKAKFETELSIRMSVENDINGLRTMLDNLTLMKSQLETEIENLKEELIYIRKNHEDELRSLKSQMSGNVSVDVTAEDSVDLLKVLGDIRAKYEAMVNQNKAEADDWYKQQFAAVQQEISIKSGAIDGEKSRLTELRHSCQGLETELSTMQSIIASLEGNLNEVDMRFSGERANLQMTINGLEGDLGDLRAKILSMSQEYQRLLNIKSRLEAEIETYRRLLGGYGGQSSGQVSSKSTIQKTVFKEERKLSLGVAHECCVPGCLRDTPVREPGLICCRCARLPVSPRRSGRDRYTLAPAAPQGSPVSNGSDLLRGRGRRRDRGFRTLGVSPVTRDPPRSPRRLTRSTPSAFFLTPSLSLGGGPARDEDIKRREGGGRTPVARCKA